MAGITLEKGKKIYTYGQPLTAVHLIASGKVKVAYPGGFYTLARGGVIGICEICSEIHFLEYTVMEATSILTYPLNSLDSLGDLLQQHPEIARLFVISAFHQINSLFNQCSISEPECHNFYRSFLDDLEKYNTLCTRYRIAPRTLEVNSEACAFLGDESADFWANSLYLGLLHIYSGTNFKPLLQEPGISIGLLRKCALDFRRNHTVLEEQFHYRQQITELYFNESSNDIFDFYTSLYQKLGADCAESGELLERIQNIITKFQPKDAEEHSFITERILSFQSGLSKQEISEDADAPAVDLAASSELSGSLNTILNFAAADNALASSFRKHIQAYKALPDKGDTEDETCLLRKRITEEFNQLYALLFRRSLEAGDIPLPVKMFLYFGYVDEELAGEANCAILENLVKTHSDRTEFGIYTFYEWLLAIYDGKKEPSRNEFDQDYNDYIHKQKATGNLTDAQFRAMEEDSMEKVNYELENLFPSVNKMTFGRPASYCPVFIAENVLKSLEASHVTLTQVSRAFEAIKTVDYSAFYRESLDFEHMDVMGKEPIHLEFLPDVILMPNVGLRGVMWQEIQGKQRNSSGRMVFSIFHMEDFTNSLVRLAGEFRWEMCKRVQGGRWNDVSERSLTSEYFDYIQFYRKNHELTNEAKEKVRSSLQRAKNSFKEMFVRDYIVWVLFEGNGSPRLNKVARRILFTYCPFSADILETAKQNPLYTELLNRRQILTAQKLHHLDMLAKKLMNSGTAVPETLEEERKYVKGDFSQ